MQKQINLLIVDDDVSHRLILSEFSEIAGYDYMTARNGREAIDILSQPNDIKIILMDIEMPIMNGIEAIKEIRGNLDSQYNKTPVIAMTAHDREFLKQLVSDFSDQLLKPYTLNQFKRKIEQYFNNISHPI